MTFSAPCGLPCDETAGFFYKYKVKHLSTMLSRLSDNDLAMISPIVELDQ